MGPSAVDFAKVPVLDPLAEGQAALLACEWAVNLVALWWAFLLACSSAVGTGTATVVASADGSATASVPRTAETWDRSSA